MEFGYGRVYKTRPALRTIGNTRTVVGRVLLYKTRRHAFLRYTPFRHISFARATMHWRRSAVSTFFLFAAVFIAHPASAQVDFSGEWAPRFWEDRLAQPLCDDRLGR